MLIILLDNHQYFPHAFVFINFPMYPDELHFFVNTEIIFVDYNKIILKLKEIYWKYNIYGYYINNIIIA